jgi:uncharacterized membrane protein YcaP (DUF421 family)
MVNVWFAGWEPIWRICVVGTLGYGVLVVLLRASGKRTLAQMNSFDFVITVAVGATFGRVMTARSVALAEAVTAFAVLIALQYIVAKMQLRSPRISSLVTASPTMLAYSGSVIDDALRRERVTEDEVLAAVRKHGYGDLSETAAVIMETDGSLAVIAPGRAGDESAVRRIAGEQGHSGA